MQSLNKKLVSKYGSKLLTHALNGYYYFQDDDIENAIDKAEIRYMGFNKSRSLIRNIVWSNENIRNKICEVGISIYGTS